jgi:hypothetical protein
VGATKPKKKGTKMASTVQPTVTASDDLKVVDTAVKTCKPFVLQVMVFNP